MPSKNDYTYSLKLASIKNSSSLRGIFQLSLQYILYRMSCANVDREIFTFKIFCVMSFLWTFDAIVIFVGDIFCYCKVNFVCQIFVAEDYDNILTTTFPIYSILQYTTVYCSILQYITVYRPCA